MITQDGKYLKYSEYRSLGGNLERKEFIRYEFEAKKHIDRATFGRLTNLKTQKDEVKICIVNLIESIVKYSSNSKRDISIASENIDGYTVNYNSNSDEIKKSKDTEIEDIIRQYLSDCCLDDGTPYLYRGRCKK